ncbi:hypothetical protein NFI96_020577, partial [Prochilodus magdalenae]
MGNRLTHQIQELTLDTSYYFKIQARNSKGMGPLSDTVQFRTPKVGFHGTPGGRSPLPDHGFGSTLDKPGITGSQENHILVIVIIVSVGVFTIIAVVVGAFLCTRRSNSHQKKKRAACKPNNGSHKYKSTSKDLKPPDLWIHHERLEMKPIDKSPEPNPVMTETPIPRSQDPSSESGHPRRNSFRGHEIEESVSTLAGRKGVRPKIMMPFDSQPPQHHSLTTAPAHSFLSWPLFRQGLSSSETKFSVRTQAPVPEPPVAPTQPPSAAELQHTEAVIKEEDPPSYKPPTAHVHPTHPMKSFAVPTVSVSAHNPPSSALPCTPLLAQPGQP